MFSKVDVLQVVELRTRTGRRKKGLVIVEGLPEFRRTVEAKAQIERLYICEKIVPLDAFDFKPFNPVLISKDEFAQIAFGSRLKGVLAFCRPKQLTLADLKKKKDPLLLVLESIEKPGNLGTIIRSCDAAGVDAVICCDQKTEIYNQHVVRSSIGSLFSVSVVSADKKETIAYLQKNKIQILPTSAHAQKVYNTVDLKRASAIVIGSEHKGVSKEFIENASEFIKIPMRGVSSSLNAAMSASILCFEADRQRRMVSG
ncbi:hypothetical protein MNBD_BACTEROID05-916 [hydrothermal vent metagenome]|uniref:Uncharacterized protein n=1 Tax=hydrothermal vent metagenome TaxID=652676 RepID=A0A3B0TDF3_9ZZZZ